MGVGPDTRATEDRTRRKNDLRIAVAAQARSAAEVEFPPAGEGGDREARARGGPFLPAVEGGCCLARAGAVGQSGSADWGGECAVATGGAGLALAIGLLVFASVPDLVAVGVYYWLGGE